MLFLESRSESRRVHEQSKYSIRCIVGTVFCKIVDRCEIEIFPSVFRASVYNYSNGTLDSRDVRGTQDGR